MPMRSSRAFSSSAFVRLSRVFSDEHSTHLRFWLLPPPVFPFGGGPVAPPALRLSALLPAVRNCAPPTNLLPRPRYLPTSAACVWCSACCICCSSSRSRAVSGVPPSPPAASISRSTGIIDDAQASPPLRPPPLLLLLPLLVPLDPAPSGLSDSPPGLELLAPPRSPADAVVAGRCSCWMDGGPTL